MKYKIKQFSILLKLVLAYFWLHIFQRGLLRKEIWLVMEKKTEARDNGYNFFKYLRQKHPELEAYYAILPSSADVHKIGNLGNILDADSFQHYLYYLAAKYSINSQAYGAAPGNPRVVHKLKRFFAPNQKTIFLQHGIIKDDMTDAYRYDITQFDLFCCGAKREHEYIIAKYGYPEDKAKLLGLCRYDRLMNNRDKVSKQILIMPTFRNWLQSTNAVGEVSDVELEHFTDTEYYKQYSNLISNSQLQSFARAHGYKLVFYPHYAMQPYIRAFTPFENDVLCIASRKQYDVQDLLIESNILITDYSSVYFDFAYLQKPVIYFQFDEQEYREKHYKKGYFDYRADGFGPVLTESRQVIEETERIIGTGAAMNPMYLQRTDGFFEYHDSNNCQRTYEAILEV